MSYPTTLSALQFLSARCDGAASLDGQGFNGRDSDFGKSLAERTSLTPKQAACAARLLSKYSRQLALAGITVDAIRAEVNAAPVKTEAREVGLNGVSFTVKLLGAGDVTARNELKEMCKARYDADTYQWRVNFDQGKNLLRWARSWEAVISPEALDRIKNPVVVETTTTEVEIDAAGDIGIITFSGDRFDEIKDAVKATGARWQGQNKYWAVRIAGDNIDSIISLITRFNTSLTSSAHDAVEAAKIEGADLLVKVAASQATDADIVINGLGGSLLPFQRAGVAALAGNDHTGLLADEQGLGKTVQALASLAHQGEEAFPALVVCESHIKISWERHVAQWLPGRSCTVLSGRTPDPKAIKGYDVVICNYDILAAWKEVLAA